MSIRLSSWHDMQLANTDVVFEKNGARHLGLRKCDQKLGKKDGLMRLTKPSRPEWMSRDFYNQWVPDKLTIRVIKNKKRTIVTTLLNPEQYPKKRNYRSVPRALACRTRLSGDQEPDAYGYTAMQNTGNGQERNRRSPGGL